VKTLAIVLGTALLAGCARFHPQPISPQQTAAQMDARRLDDPGLRRFVERALDTSLPRWPLPSWDLNSLTLAALYYHPDLAVARAQWRVAEAGIRSAGARPNPSVTAAPGFDSGIPGNFSPWLLPVTLDVPVETAGKRAARVAGAKEAARSAYWKLIATAWQIRSGVRAGLLDFAVAGRRARLLSDQLSSQEQIVKLLAQRVQAGEIPRPELVAAQIALSRAWLDYSDSQSKQAEARSRLAGSLGVTAAALDGLNLAFDWSSQAPAELTSAAARRVALLGRPDILGALADYAASQSELRLQIAKQYPDLHLGPGYAWNNGNAGDSQWSLGLTLELPILDQNQGPIAEAEASRELAAAQFIALQAGVIGDIDRAVTAYDTAKKQLITSDALLAAQEKQRQSVAAQLKAGAADSLDSISAQLEFDSAALAQLDGLVRFQTALGSLEDALQRPADSISAAIEIRLSQPTVPTSR
jgi:outer membrane protein TolC